MFTVTRTGVTTGSTSCDARVEWFGDVDDGLSGWRERRGDVVGEPVDVDVRGQRDDGDLDADAGQRYGGRAAGDGDSDVGRGCRLYGRGAGVGERDDRRQRHAGDRGRGDRCRGAEQAPEHDRVHGDAVGEHRGLDGGDARLGWLGDPDDGLHGGREWGDDLGEPADVDIRGGSGDGDGDGDAGRRFRCRERRDRDADDCRRHRLHRRCGRLGVGHDHRQRRRPGVAHRLGELGLRDRGQQEQRPDCNRGGVALGSLGIDRNRGCCDVRTARRPPAATTRP